MTQATLRQRRTALRSLGLALGLFALLPAANMIRAWWLDRSLPHHQGQSARVWLDRMRRQMALEEAGLLADVAERVRAQRAFLAMGPAAHPFLVARTLEITESTTLTQRAFDGAHKVLRSYRIRWLTPRWLESAAARQCLADQPVSMALLRAAADQRLSGVSNAPPPFPIIDLLGLAAQADRAEAASRLTQAYARFASDGSPSGAILRSLQKPGFLTAATLGPILPMLTNAAPTLAFARIQLAHALGPEAAPLRPWLESLAHNTNGPLAVRADLALLQIDPGHSNALDRIARLLHPTESRAPSWLRGHETPASFVATYLQHPTTRTHATLADLLEPWVRACWQPPIENPRRHLALRTLALLAPDRARQLLDALLDGPARVEAAAELLRLDRDHRDATRILAEAIESQPWWEITPLYGLREASRSNEIAVATLEQYAHGTRVFPLAGEAARRHARSVREMAQLGLEWMAYREERAELGLSEPSW